MVILGIMSSPNLLLKNNGVGRFLGDFWDIFSKGLQSEKTSWEILKTFLGREIEMISVGSYILRFSTFWDERTKSRIEMISVPAVFQIVKPFSPVCQAVTNWISCWLGWI